MKRFMEIFEDLMVAVAFAEEGISYLLPQQKDNLYKESGEQTWDLNG